MHATMKMAGTVVSHALWSVSDGSILTPILATLGADESHRMERLMMGSAQAVAYGAERLASLAPDVLGAVLVKDGLVTLPTGRTDALIVDVRFGEDSTKRLQLLVPYRNARHPEGFAVHRLKLLEKEGIGEDALEALLGNFLRGLESDEKGGRLWKEKYVDQAGAGDVSAGEENTEFTAEEFAILKRSLFHVLFLVARADGKVDKGEVESLAKIVQDPERFGSPLLNRIATNVIEEFSGWFLVVSMGESDYNLEELAKARVMVDAKLSVEASRAFKAALLAVGNEVANAAGGFFSKVSKEERATLASIASALGVSSS